MSFFFHDSFLIYKFFQSISLINSSFSTWPTKNNRQSIAKTTFDEHKTRNETINRKKKNPYIWKVKNKFLSLYLIYIFFSCFLIIIFFFHLRFGYVGSRPISSTTVISITLYFLFYSVEFLPPHLLLIIMEYYIFFPRSTHFFIAASFI